MRNERNERKSFKVEIQLDNNRVTKLVVRNLTEIDTTEYIIDGIDESISITEAVNVIRDELRGL